MPSDIDLVRQLGKHEKRLRVLRICVELMQPLAESAPTKEMMAEARARGERYKFHRFSIEHWQGKIASFTEVLADLNVIINDLKRRYFPERTEWDGPLSYEWLNAVRDAELDKLVEADREIELRKSRHAMERMSNTAAARQRRKPGRPRKDGASRLMEMLTA